MVKNRIGIFYFDRVTKIKSKIYRNHIIPLRLVVSAGVVHLISIALVGWGSGREKDDRLEPIPALEEKTAAAIMLY